MNKLLLLPLGLYVALVAPACDSSSDSDDSHASASEATVDAHVEVVRQRLAATNAKDWDTWQALHTDDAVRTSPDLPEPLVGAAAMRAGIEELVVTFPDYHLELVEAFGSGDRLVARIHTRGTMNGPLALGDVSIPATGRSFEQDWVAVLRFEGDRIAAIDEFYDNYGTMLQLGLAEAP